MAPSASDGQERICVLEGRCSREKERGGLSCRVKRRGRRYCGAGEWGK